LGETMHDDYVDPFTEAMQRGVPTYTHDNASTGLRTQYHFPTHLSEEVDGLVGYDRAAMFHGFEAASNLRREAKARVAQLQSRIAKLAARFETHGTQPSQAEHERSRELAEIQDDIRVEYSRNPEKEKVPPKRKDEEPTERVVHLTVAEVEARAKASPRYKRFLENQGREREEYQTLKAKLAVAWAEYEEVKEKGELIRLQLEDRKALLYFAGNDPFRKQPQQGT
jgi:hypothetical protein